jgi:uncharacterized metal-binding protein YceD (DUF177 family)
MTNKSQSPWNVQIRADDVPETGRKVDLVADAAVREAIAKLAGLRALPRLEAHFEVTRHGSGLRVAGQVSATVEQTCGVTLEALNNEVAEAVDAVYVPPAAGDGPESDDEGLETDEGPEPLVDGTADLGTLATEFLLLGIDPYPRRPDAVFAPPAAPESAGGGAFAALAALKKDRGAGQT